MKMLTQKESEAMLLLFKDFSKNYNANSISAVLDITPRGALKILKNLKRLNLLRSKVFGKGTFYKINFEDNYAVKTMETLLIQESRENASRWLSELDGLLEISEIVIIFGSVVKEPKNAKDVDIMIAVLEKHFENAEKFIKDKNNVLLKPIHPIYQSPKDIKNNLDKRQPVLVNALKEGYVLHGYEKLIDVMKYATDFQ